MEISYDPEKRAATLERRGLDFEDAVEVFAGATIQAIDDRQDYGEKRWQTYGSLRDRLVTIVWTQRGNVRHIISMRSAMTESKRNSDDSWDPDTAPEWPDEVWDRAQISIGGKVIREATGTLTKAGRPPIGAQPKQQVTLRLPRDVIGHFKAGGPGWQTRIGEVLERYAAKAGGRHEESR